MKTTITLVFSIIFISCSHSIKIKTGVNRFLSSEAQGRIGKGNIETFIIKGTEASVDLRNEQTKNSLKLSKESTRALDIGIAGEIGIWTPLDLIHVSGDSMGSDLTGLKLQIYGNNRKDAKKHNFSVSLYAGNGSVINNVQEGNDLELVPTNDDTTSEFKITNQTTGILIGHRPEEKLQVTLGYHIIQHSFAGDLSSQNINLDGKSINYKGKSNLTTFTITYNLTKLFYLASELSSEVIKWEHTKEAHFGFINLGVGFMW